MYKFQRLQVLKYLNSWHGLKPLNIQYFDELIDRRDCILRHYAIFRCNDTTNFDKYLPQVPQSN